MTKPEPGPDDVFDIERIRRLVELMEEHDLGEVDLRQSEQRIRLKRGADMPATFAMPQAAPMPSAPPPIAASQTAEDDPNIVFVRSPMVGTFYSRSKPEAEPYVKVGDHIGEETTVCIIEAMKMFNEIQAEVSGQIVAVLVKNEEPVDVNKPLFKVDTSK
ncbi:MAG: acetyl-CoA carboxylase biotin carboxyl carrier protein [Pirellulaceae bacterium]